MIYFFFPHSYRLQHQHITTSGFITAPIKLRPPSWLEMQAGCTDSTTQAPAPPKQPNKTTNPHTDLRLQGFNSFDDCCALKVFVPLLRKRLYYFAESIRTWFGFPVHCRILQEWSLLLARSLSRSTRDIRSRVQCSCHSIWCHSPFCLGLTKATKEKSLLFQLELPRCFILYFYSPVWGL